jgi:hypothetical protein
MSASVLEGVVPRPRPADGGDAPGYDQRELNRATMK